MPPPPRPLPDSPAAASQTAAQAAVTESVVNPTPTASTAMGAVAGIAQTRPGAIGLTAATTVTSTGIGMLSNLPELSSIGWLSFFIFQHLKNWRLCRQDQDKGIWLVGIAAVTGLGMCYLTSHGDWWTASAKAAMCAGPAAYAAMLSYETIRPLSMFSSAPGPSDAKL